MLCTALCSSPVALDLYRVLLWEAGNSKQCASKSLSCSRIFQCTKRAGACSLYLVVVVAHAVGSWDLCKGIIHFVHGSQSQGQGPRIKFNSTQWFPRIPGAREMATGIETYKQLSSFSPQRWSFPRWCFKLSRPLDGPSRNQRMGHGPFIGVKKSQGLRITLGLDDNSGYSL